MPSEREQKVDEFVAITGSSKQTAESLLAVCNDNLEMAINMHMEGVQIEDNNSRSSSASNGTQPGTSSSSTAAAAHIGDPDDDDEVRAPIPQKREVLIQPGFEGYSINRSSNMLRANRVRSVFDGFRNFSNEAKNYSQGPARKGKKRTLEELFKPPIDMMFKGDFQSARDSATSAKKWLMVNIQDACEFQCQVLNRDVWSNAAVKTILREHFIFWQQYKESEDAQRYLTFYPVTDWPYVAILDPRTGEHLVTWNKIDASSFCDLVTEFLSLHPSLSPQDPEKSEEAEVEPESKKAKTSESILDADEDDQIAAAIQASLKEQSAKKQKVENSDNSDDEDDDDDGDYFESFSAEVSNSSFPTRTAKKIEEKETDTSKDLFEVDDNNEENWEKYLGDKDDAHSSIMIRFPDGNRVTKDIPCSSQFQAIVGYVASEGYSLDKHEIVTNFPRRILTDLDTTQTLKDLGLFPKETVFVQQK